MATLVLQVAGHALGTMIGGPFGGVIGRAAGAIAGNIIDTSLIAASQKPMRVDGPRLDDLQVQTSAEGAFIPRVYGRTRLAGQVIWATRFEEEISTSTHKSGGKGGVGGRKTTVTEYNYYANFAVGLCEGDIGRIGRVWADGKQLDLSAVTMRVYKGSVDQLPDSLITAREGAGNAPAYRGLAYAVFEHLPIGQFGNRIPQLMFEIFRPLDEVEERISSVNIIPGATEFGYHTDQITRDLGNGKTGPENTHTYEGISDWSISIDDLTASCPNLKTAALVVTWFGGDLRCGQCELKPGVENREKTTRPEIWTVAGMNRSNARLVSEADGHPAFGGTPSDASVIAAIKDLKSRGKKVLFYPFLMMDIPDGNTLPDPWTGDGSQPVYPWRGRITCDPAPGQTGTVDKTAAAATQVNDFFGTAAISDFAINGETVTYSGPAEWSLRRMVLHYAHLCKAAGGVDAFLIGSEFKALTTVRSSASDYPAVDALVTLANDVKTVLGAFAKISYAADWAEYYGHHPDDGLDDVYFHLDPLWASSGVDFIGIDNYMPLADWRDGTAHLDWQSGWRSIYDTAYMRANIKGGEGHDWYYADATARDGQTRTPITDGAYSKPWVFRWKDLKSWWSNSHYDRPGGIESATPTAWTPESKPIWFTELGCPAIDKGANQPNIFYDAKSSESALPYYSQGGRDDLMQRRFVQAVQEYWDPASSKYETGANPVSSVYGARMVDIDNICLWAWDARPFPAFPQLEEVWADAPNWQTGHWLNGRLGSAPLDRLVKALADPESNLLETSGLEGLIEGYVLDRSMSARQAIEPLSLSHFFDAVESEGKIRCSHRKDAPVLEVETDSFAVKSAKSPAWKFTRAQETELPSSVRLSYIDAMAGYRRAAVEARRLVGSSARAARADLPIVMDQARARAIAEIWLQELWQERERAAFTLPSGLLELDPGDVVEFTANNRTRSIRLTEISDGGGRAVSGVSAESSLYTGVPAVARNSRASAPPVLGPVLAEFMDLPLLTGSETAHAGYYAAFADPWPGGVAFYRSPGQTGHELGAILEAPATMGETLWDFYRGPTSRWDNGNSLRIRLYGGALQSVDRLQLLSGSNAAAICNPDGEWEIIQFLNATLVDEDTYDLSVFLRGQSGTENAMRDPVPVGARFVLLDGAIMQSGMSADEIGLGLNYVYGPWSRDMADPAYQTAVVTFEGVGLRPLSPVHLRGARDQASQDIELTWIRRTRINGDAWALEEAPLGEDMESYELKILNAGLDILRTVQIDEPRFTYTSAMQIEDFGVNPSQITAELAQASQSYGAGSFRRTIIYV